MKVTPLVQTTETLVPAWGHVTYLRIYTPDYQPLSWLEVWQAFNDIYPDRWAIELYPPADDLINDAHVYHLWLLPEEWSPPDRMNLAERLRW